MVFVSFPVFADRAPEHLKDPAKKAAFYRITAHLNCYCGCHGTAGNCGHIDENCFGVQIRRFVENRLAEGMEEEKVKDGLVRGFGASIRTDSQILRLEKSGREDLVRGFESGFGPEILYEEPASWPLIALFGAGSAVFFLFARKVMARGKQRDIAKKTQTGQLERFNTIDR